MTISARPAAKGDEGINLAGAPPAGERGVDNERQRMRVKSSTTTSTRKRRAAAQLQALFEVAAS